MRESTTRGDDSVGFVKTPEEIERISALLKNVEFVGCEVLRVDFLTHPETVEQILPPGLEPGDTPQVSAMVGRWRSNCVADFVGGGIGVSARCGDFVGSYVLALYMNTDAATIFGRDVYGEPKKLATNALYRRGDNAYGYLDRGGARLIDISVELESRTGPTTGNDNAFNIKSSLAPDGSGLAGDATIVLTEFTSTVRSIRSGRAKLSLAGTPHDPLDEIAIVEVLGGHLVESDRRAKAREIGQIPADDFLPYALGRMDDWSLLSTAS
jgi:acetoacetate decarboxylase